MDPFLQSDQDHESVGRSLRPKTHHSGKFLYFQQRSKDFMVLFSHFDMSNTEGRSDQIDVGKLSIDISSSSETNRDFTVQGQRKDVNTIFLKLRIADSTGCLFFSFHFLVFLIVNQRKRDFHLHSCVKI